VSSDSSEDSDSDHDKKTEDDVPPGHRLFDRNISYKKVAKKPQKLQKKNTKIQQKPQKKRPIISNKACLEHAGH
jgi:hypothetical protein